MPNSAVPIKAWVYLVFFVCVNFTLGALYSFSFWKVGFFKYFPQCDNISNITKVSRANPVTLTFEKRHGFVTGRDVQVSGVSGHGWDALLGSKEKVTVVSETEIQLDGVDGAGAGTPQLSGAQAEEVTAGRCWTTADLTTTYGLGAVGAFICVVPGWIIDKFGPIVAGIYGLVLINVGYGSIIALLGGGSATPTEVGLLYMVEEQGSATLFMLVFCLAMPAFPQQFSGLVGGAVSVSYGMSSLLWQIICPSFGFHSDSTFINDTNLKGFLILILICMDTAGVLMLIFSRGTPRAEEELGGSAAGGSLALTSTGSFTNLPAMNPDGPLAQAMLNPKGKAQKLPDVFCNLDFIVIFVLFGFVSSQGTSFFGYLSNVPTAFSGLNSDAYGALAFNSNTWSRIIYGVAMDGLYAWSGPKAAIGGVLFIHLSYCFFFGVYFIAGFASAGFNGFLLYISQVFGFAAYGGSNPIVSAHVKAVFAENRIGLVMGMFYTIIAFMNLFFSNVFGPANSTGDPSLYVPSDFRRPWTLAVLCAFGSLPLTLVWVLRALWRGRQVRLSEGRNLEMGGTA